MAANILIALGAPLVLLGASAASGKLFSLFFREDPLRNNQAMLLGFGMFGPLLSVGGYLSLFRIPYLSSLLAAAAGAYGVIVILRWIRGLAGKTTRIPWGIIAFPAGILAFLLVSKIGYLAGGTTNGDESRSMLLTVSLASNALRPAYPFDFSLPIVYPFYVFEMAAFLYAAIRGTVSPTVILLPVTLFTLSMAWVALWECTRRLFPQNRRSAFVLAGVLLAFSSARWIVTDTFTVAPFVTSGEIQTFSGWIHAGYHYLFGGMLGVLGIIHAMDFLRDERRKDALLAAVFLSLSCGIGGIVGAWIGLALIVAALPVVIARIRSGRTGPLLRSITSVLLPTLSLIALVLLPQWANALPRLAKTFEFSLPHLWFPREVTLMASGSGLLHWLRTALLGPVILTVNMGVILAFSLFVSPLLLLLDRKPTDEHRRLIRPMLWGAVSVLILLTITKAPSGDWFGRGSVAMALIAVLIGTHFVLRCRKAFPRLTTALLCILLLAQGYSFVREGFVAPHAADTPFREKVREWPLGTVFYSTYYTDTMEEVVRGGRAVISLPPVGFQAYIPDFEVLTEWLHLPITFSPCQASAYGSNTPLGRVVFVLPNGTLIEKDCIRDRKDIPVQKIEVRYPRERQ